MRITLDDMNKDKQESSTLTPVTDHSSDHEKAKHPTKGMTPRQMISYYSTYYLPKFLFISVIVAFILIFFVLIFGDKPHKISILMVNHHNSYADDVHAALEGYKTEHGFTEKDTIKVNATHNFDVTNLATVESREAFIASVSSREYTILFADEAVFTECAKATYFRYLSEYLSDDLIERYKDDIIMGYDDLTGQEYPCGICLNRENCPFLQNTTYEECCFGVLFSDPELDEYQSMVEYILNWEP